MLPDFVIIGAMKSGTTSLYHYLNAHPQVGMSEIKETDFFIKEKNYSKGIEWYESQFKGNFKIYGEASPNYTKAHYHEGVPKRMHDLVPDVKLIYILRDPVERIISHYTHNCGAGRESGDINKAFQNKQKFEHYVNCSKYYWQLKQYLMYFPKEQILIISSDDLKKNRKSTLKKVFEFIEVNPAVNLDDQKKEFGTTAKKRSKGKLWRLFLDNILMNQLKKNIPIHFKRRLRRALLPSLEKPAEINASVINKLQRSLESDIKELRSYSNHSFAEWSV